MSSLERLATREPDMLAQAPSAAWRGRRHGEDRLHLLVRDPHRVFAAWEVSRELAGRAAAMAASKGAVVRYTLVLERRGEGGEGEAREVARVAVPDAVGGEGWYVQIPTSGGSCRAVLGLELPDGFEPLLASRWMPVPPDGPCRETGEWPVDEVRRAWLERESERLRGRVVTPLPSSAARYLASPQAPKS